MDVFKSEKDRGTVPLADLVALVHGSEESLKKYQRWERYFAENPLFDRSGDALLTRSEYIEKAVDRSLETYKIVKKDKDLLAAHSPLHGEGGLILGDLNVSTGVADHFGLFVGTLLLQGTKQQQAKWLRPAIQLEIIGTYAQTELGHGSNIRELETTADYDVSTDEFIMNSPTVSSTKWWPGALGLLATHALVYAKLRIGGKNLGFHAFVVPIRDLATHHCLPGVECGDIGPKMGYTGYDSGYLRLNGVRIPRDNMLARFQQVAKGGGYSSAPKELQKIAYFTMLRTRVLVAVGAGLVLAKSSSIAVRFSLLQHGLFGGVSRPLADHPAQLRGLLRVVGGSFTLILATRGINALFKDTERDLRSSNVATVKAASRALPELHGLSCGMKAFVTDIAVSLVDQAKCLCGEFGSLASAGFSTMFYNFLPAITYEGDIAPMALQCARLLFRTFTQVMSGAAGKSLGRSVAYLTEGASLSTFTQRPKHLFRRGSRHYVMNPLDIVHDFVAPTARSAIARACFKLVSVMKKEAAKHGAASSDPKHRKAAFDAAWSSCQVFLFRAARLHIRCVLCREAVHEMQRHSHLKPSAIQAVERLVAIFAIHGVVDPTISPSIDSRVGAAQETVLREVEHELNGLLRPDLMILCEAFGHSEYGLSSVLAGASNREGMLEAVSASADRATSFGAKRTAEVTKALSRGILRSLLDEDYLKAHRPISHL